MVKGNKSPARSRPPAVQFALGALALSLLVGACAPSVGGWRSPARNEASTRADYADCRAQAEEITLTQTRSDRTGYGLEGTSRPGPFDPRGDDPMAIAERSDTVSLYDRLVAGCMTSKGYRRPGES